MNKIISSLYFKLILHSKKLHRLCILAFVVPSFPGYLITIVDCNIFEQITPDMLAEFKELAIPVAQLDQSILYQDNIVNYKIVLGKPWKDRLIYTIIDQGQWTDWLDDINPEITNQTVEEKKDT